LRLRPQATCLRLSATLVCILIIAMFALLGGLTLWISIVSRIVLIPVVAIISYEIMKFGVGHISKRVVRILLAPGLMLQAMTTEEPDANQREAAILALNEAVEIDKAAYSSYNA